MSLKNGLISILTLFFATSVANGAVILESFISTRAAGMGNAYVSVVDNHDALFYNPAALDKIHGFHFHVFDFQMGTDTINITPMINDFSSSDLSTSLGNYFGQRFWMGLANVTSITMQGFGIGVFGNINLGFLLSNPAFPNLNVDMLADTGIAAGFGFSLVPSGLLRLGFVGKWVLRAGRTLPFGPSTIAELNNEFVNELRNNVGSGYGMDTALMIELPTGFRPTFSAVWQNVGQVRFGNSTSSNIPYLENNLTGGFALTIPALVMDIRPAFDVRNITMWSEQITKKLHFGIEFDLPIIDIRGGFNQGYYTLGLGVNLGFIDVQLATYGVEMGAYAGQKEDRRYVLEAAIDLNFKEGFSFQKTKGRTPAPRFRRR